MGVTAAGVIGALLGVAIIAAIAVFGVKHYRGRTRGPSRVYSSFDNEMSRVR